jgi:hypothetical protein
MSRDMQILLLLYDSSAEGNSLSKYAADDE